MVVADMSGRITIGEGATLLHDAMREFKTAGHRKILIDLSGVAFMDSSGIGELVSGYVSITHSAGRVKFSGLSRRIRDLFIVTRLYSVLDIHETEADALRSFA